MVIQKIAKKQGNKYYVMNWLRIHRCCGREDFVQTIYERLWRDNLWDCKDHGLIYVVAQRACIDFCRSMIYGHRQKKEFSIVEFEDEAVKIYDSHWYEIMSLKELAAKLPFVQKTIVKNLIKGHTLKEIGEMVNRTESRICQVRAEIIGRLITLYKKDGVK